MMTQKKMDFAVSVADYVATHPKWDELTPRQAIIEAVGVLVDDIGGAQALLNLLDVPYDLYDRKPT